MDLTPEPSKKRLYNEAFAPTLLAKDIKRTQRRLAQSDYTIGWIAALPVEVTAAEAMFDEHHLPLVNASGDSNAYSLGSILGRNVVLACLPLGCYGTTEAAVVAAQMRASYPSITSYLMVGIGGGVPSDRHDIRLGDVVVSIPRPDFPAVVQYDFGKTVDGGVSVSKSRLNKPPPLLLTASNLLVSRHQSGTNHIKDHMSEALCTNASIAATLAAPTNFEDVLYEIECEHLTEDGICAQCGPRIVKERSARSNCTPVIHYGTIGSGSQVIKHGRTRDRLAQPYDILCFEMEAAGLMDHIPCLVIRGVCDYCDTTKNKRFQGYAALTAAAYAKELISFVPSQVSAIKSESVSDMTFETAQDRSKHRQQMIMALDYDEAEARRDTVRKAHPQTCSWLPQHTGYTDWLDVAKLETHHGLLWIRGKPGTGKSTLMKYIYEHVESLKSTDSVTISFFFNARGEELEKSSIGMYRSLLSQLFKKCPRLQSILDQYSSAQSEVWRISTLQTMIKQAINELGSTKLFCFIDALDECPEEQMKKMLAFLEELCQIAVDNSKYIRICLSSRHYPHVTIEAGVEFTLEEQDGHQHDLQKYIAAELKIGKSRQAELIKVEILEKSRHIFLWLVLVVQILKDEFNRGRVHALRARLDDIPLELDELFMDILKRDTRSLEELVLCMQWILFARRPMRREEFYFALLAQSEELAPWDNAELTPQDMDRYILDCSKGLAETTRSKNPTVQFIHESVREFLHKEGTLDKLWAGFKDVAPFTSHKKLKESSNRYLKLDKRTEITRLEQQRLAPGVLSERVRKMFPFLGYAVEQLLAHAEEMEKLQPSQTAFIAEFQLDAWVRLYNIMQRFQVRRHSSQTKLAYIFARHNHPHLLALALRNPAIFGEGGSSFETLVSQSLDDKDDKNMTAFKTLAKLRDNTVISFDDEEIPYGVMYDYLQSMKNPKTGVLFHPDSVIDSLNGVVRLLQSWTTNDNQLLNNVFLDAVTLRHEDTVTFLLDHGADINAINSNGNTALHLVALHRHLPRRRSKNHVEQSDEASVISMVDLLLSRNVNVDAKNHEGATALHIAIIHSTQPVVDTLIERGASALMKDIKNRSACQIAMQAGKMNTFRRLLDFWNLDAYQKDNVVWHLTQITQPVNDIMLRVAIRSNSPSLLAALLDLDADAKASDTLGGLLLDAVELQKVDLAKILVDRGADLETVSKDKRTPLMLAARQGNLEMTDLLIKRGSQLEVRNHIGRTPLHSAVCNFHVEVAVRLLTSNAYANCVDDAGVPVLHDAATISGPDLIEALLDHGAEIEAQVPSGWTALHYAAYHENTNAVDVLIRRGARATLPPKVEGMNDAKWLKMTEHKFGGKKLHDVHGQLRESVPIPTAYDSANTSYSPTRTLPPIEGMTS